MIHLVFRTDVLSFTVIFPRFVKMLYFLFRMNIFPFFVSFKGAILFTMGYMLLTYLFALALRTFSYCLYIFPSVTTFLPNLITTFFLLSRMAILLTLFCDMCCIECFLGTFLLCLLLGFKPFLLLYLPVIFRESSSFLLLDILE